jgi:hypothetical protein
MPPNTTVAQTRRRLVNILFGIISLVHTSLSSVTAYYATVLQDRAKFDLVTASNAGLDITFQKLIENVRQGIVIVALISVLALQCDPM